MSYINKAAILKAYKQLSQLSDNPNLQGATQKVSVVRYFMALDSFFKTYQRPCNTRNRLDKEAYIKCVGQICEVCTDLYTTNFFVPLKKHNGDFSVGSNLYSAGQVKVSLIKPQDIVDYPIRKGMEPLFKIENGTLIRSIDYYSNFDTYIHSVKFKVALVIWILRNTNIKEDGDISKCIIDGISELYTQDLVDLLLNDEKGFMKELELYGITLNENCYNIDEKDIYSLFGEDDLKEGLKHSQKFLSIGSNCIINHLPALRTKPFMLLAGISGTGKSRLVREMAFMSCPKALQDQDQTQPGNYCMIEVKPNWHDSTELLGYWSNISKKYMFTPFVKFLVKAMMYPDVPFFVCLDEMNLAPVEQYLAELLSVLETRKLTIDKRIRTGVLVNSEYFEKLAGVDGTHDANGKPYRNLKNDGDIYKKLLNPESLKGGENEEALAADTLCTSGLTLPDNVIIIGTVNMDDTTHKFSRKVIDRAMTIEMNGGELNSIFGGSSRLEYRADNEVVGLDAFKAEYVSADDAINDCLRMSPFAERITGGEEEDGTLAHRLKAINDCLEGTPFQVSYRVMNELVIYLAVLLDSEDGEVSEERFDELMSKAVDDILLMKILPRIEGDEQMFVTSGGNRLDSLLGLTSPDSASHKKLLEMKERLGKSFFTRFWP